MMMQQQQLQSQHVADHHAISSQHPNPHQASQQTLFQTPDNMAGFIYGEGNSTLHLVPSTVKTAELNLDHDIAGEFEAAIDHSKLESRNKYDFMNLHQEPAMANAMLM